MTILKVFAADVWGPGTKILDFFCSTRGAVHAAPLEKSVRKIPGSRHKGLLRASSASFQPAPARLAIWLPPGKPGISEPSTLLSTFAPKRAFHYAPYDGRTNPPLSDRHRDVDLMDNSTSRALRVAHRVHIPAATPRFSGRSGIPPCLQHKHWLAIMCWCDYCCRASCCCHSLVAADLWQGGRS